MPQELIRRYGIADCQGLESFLRVGSEGLKFMDLLTVRVARREPDRSLGVVYIAILDKEADEEILRLFGSEKRLAALKVLKRKAKNVEFPEDYSQVFLKRWEAILDSEAKPQQVKVDYEKSFVHQRSIPDTVPPNNRYET